MNGVGLSKPKSVDNNHNWLILLNFISKMRKIEMSPAQCRYKCPFLVELHLTRLRGKRDQHIMQVLGMFACQQTIPAHRITVDPYQTTRLADATALGDVVQH